MILKSHETRYKKAIVRTEDINCTIPYKNYKSHDPFILGSSRWPTSATTFPTTAPVSEPVITPVPVNNHEPTSITAPVSSPEPAPIQSTPNLHCQISPESSQTAIQKASASPLHQVYCFDLTAIFQTPSSSPEPSPGRS